MILSGRRGPASGQGSGGELPAGGTPGQGDKKGSGGQSGQDGQGGSGTEAGGQLPGGGASKPGGGGNMPGGGGGGNSGGGMGSQGEHPAEIPPDMPTATDDDVLARQLREAAMNETDPELREKMWEDYRRYIEG